jgi:hypothetical protein
MYQGFSIASKKSTKKSQNKSTSKKPSLESTRGTDLSESFYDQVESFGIGSSGTNSTYTDSNSFECI